MSENTNNDHVEKADPIGNTMLLQPLPSLEIECQPPIKPRSKRGQRMRIWRADR